jgi:hypothetical protein
VRFFVKPLVVVWFSSTVAQLFSLGVVHLMKKTLAYCLIPILAALLLYSCYLHKTPTLIGTWRSSQSFTFEFHKDGSLRVKDIPPDDKTLQGVTHLDGTWAMVDSSHINMEVVTSAGKDSTIYSFSISGDELKIQRPGNQGDYVYHRVKN